jgi:hypothetical protein
MTPNSSDIWLASGGCFIESALYAATDKSTSSKTRRDCLFGCRWVVQVGGEPRVLEIAVCEAFSQFPDDAIVQQLCVVGAVNVEFSIDDLDDKRGTEW